MARPGRGAATPVVITNLLLLSTSNFIMVSINQPTFSTVSSAITFIMGANTIRLHVIIGAAVSPVRPGLAVQWSWLRGNMCYT